MIERFRGSFRAKIDDRGRIKIPARYLGVLESQFDHRVYLTSLNGDHVLFYPLRIWEEIERRIATIKVRDPDIEEYLSRISFWGGETEIDPKGRILIPPDLRNRSQLVNEVLVLGKVDHLVLWNKELFESKYLTGQFSDERLDKVARIFNEIPSLPSDV